MFAILISEENLPKINEDQEKYPESLAHFFPDPYLNHPKNWYYVSGYYSEGRGDISWAAFPEYFLVKKYEFDPTKIQTDWDQIVRK